MLDLLIPHVVITVRIVLSKLRGRSVGLQLDEWWRGLLLVL